VMVEVGGVTDKKMRCGAKKVALRYTTSMIIGSMTCVVTFYTRSQRKRERVNTNYNVLYLLLLCVGVMHE
jgi:hypothetical protein